MILVIDREGRRFCLDNKFRDCAHFGSTNDCVKIYKSLFHAKNKADKIKGIVVIVPSNISVDMTGNIWDEEHQMQSYDFLTYYNHVSSVKTLSLPAKFRDFYLRVMDRNTY